jgi:hypothetical protein
MLTRTAIGLALILGTASASMAATKHHAISARHHVNVYSPYSNYFRTDPDWNVRLNLQRDWDHGR